MNITFTGNWSEEHKQIIITKLAALQSEPDTIECQCYIGLNPPMQQGYTLPFRAIVKQPGRIRRPVSYSAEGLAENICYCYDATPEDGGAFDANNY